ncbi:MAG: hypothetical protein M1830_006482 [Pleopsidium flavum]|nr:MAG: hypothetical protein M1830_006482 [Pleopsidium flavum]
MMPRLVRRQPLAHRIKAYLNPLDFLLWLSEELDSSDWDQWQKDWAIPIGIGLNVVFLIARANSGGSGGRRRGDDVFGDDGGESGWLSWFALFVVHLLSLISFLNALYTFYRKRHYRLFETSLDNPPSTPSAHRVRVDSSPLSSSPLRFLSNMLAATTAEARSHPDATRDVWELALWDPTPLCLRMFCLFSPGHVLVYWLFLPTAAQDPRPSTTVVTTIILAALLSTQLMVLQTSFSQQSKDSALIHKEVLHEYDTKYVHPRTQPRMRDVGTQYCNFGTSEEDLPDATYDDESNKVDTYTPMTIINRGFYTNPNPNYAKHTDPDGLSQRSRGIPLSTTVAPPYQTPSHLRDASSPLRPRTAIRQPQFRASMGGDGGNLGIYSHANSPLRKSASTNFAGGLPLDNRDRSGSPMKRYESPLKRETSPVKRSSIPGGLGALAAGQRWAHLQGTTARRESGRF